MQNNGNPATDLPGGFNPLNGKIGETASGGDPNSFNSNMNLGNNAYNQQNGTDPQNLMGPGNFSN